MRRRKFLGLVGGAVAWPLAARAQQDSRVRRIGWLTAGAENDLGPQADRAVLLEALSKLGWVEGRNLRIDLRFGVDDSSRLRRYAAELVGLAPDLILTYSGAATQAVKERTRTIPIIFAAAGDPVANGLVQNIARPEGNITGFSAREPTILGKWLELLKEAVPSLARVAVVFNPELAVTRTSYLASIEEAATALGVSPIRMPVRTAVGVVRALDALAAEPNGGVLMLPPPPTTFIRDTIFELAAQHWLPLVVNTQAEAAAGGLLAYATDTADLSRRAAVYVDRLLRGTKVNELPVQLPTKFQLMVNLKTAKAIGLTIPETLLARADKIIE